MFRDEFSKFKCFKVWKTSLVRWYFFNTQNISFLAAKIQTIPLPHANNDLNATYKHSHSMFPKTISVKTKAIGKMDWKSMAILNCIKRSKFGWYSIGMSIRSCIQTDTHIKCAEEYVWVIQIPMSTEWLQYGRDEAKLFVIKESSQEKNNMKISMCTHKLQVDVTLYTFVALFSVRSILFGVRQRYPKHSHILDYCLLFCFNIFLLSHYYVFNAFLSGKFSYFSILVLTVAFFDGRCYEHIFTHRF